MCVRACPYVCVCVCVPVTALGVDSILCVSDIQDRLNMMKHGRGSFLVFSGFDGTAEELGLVSTNFWLFKNNDMDAS